MTLKIKLKIVAVVLMVIDCILLSIGWWNFPPYTTLIIAVIALIIYIVAMRIRYVENS